MRHLTRTIGIASLLALPHAALAWTPTKTVEIVICSQKDSASDKMCRRMAKIMDAQGAFPAGYAVVYKPGQQGAEGLIYTKSKAADAHVLVHASNNLFFAPIAIGAKVKYNEFTPLALVATDEFILWVNADTNFHSVADFIRAVKARPSAYQMGGTGVGREDQVLTTLFEQAAGIRFGYTGFKGGADVAKALAEKRVDATVNNPSEAVDFWNQGRVRPLAVFSARRFPYAPWKDLPTMKEAGYDIHYKMMRALLAPPGIAPAARGFWIAALNKAYQTAEFQQYMKDSGLTGEPKTGTELAEHLKTQNDLNMDLLSKTDLK